MTKFNSLSRRKRFIAGAVAALAVTGGGLTVANAQSGPSPSTPTTQDSGDPGEANIKSSITAPNTPDTGKDNEAADSAALAKLAKVTPEQASAAATKAVPGKAATPELSNENGNVIYDVKVTSADGKTTTDVKVDAGNANVLAQQVDNEGADGADGEQGGDNAKTDKPDTSDTSDAGNQGGQTQSSN